jgi:predicted  nucleic acid-binding Zn-ribbon protein
MKSFDFIEEAESERAAVEEQFDEVGERIDYLEDQLKRDRKDLHQAPPEKQADIYDRIQSREKDLEEAKRLYERLRERRKSLAARIEKAKKAGDGLPTSFALLSGPERERRLTKLMEIAGEG